MELGPFGRSRTQRDFRQAFVRLSRGPRRAMERAGGRLAQLVERHAYTVDVGSSSLSPPTSLAHSRRERRLPRRSAKGEGRARCSRATARQARGTGRRFLSCASELQSDTDVKTLFKERTI